MRLENELKRQWLADLRERKRLSREALGVLIGKSEQIIYQWEAGIRNPSRENRIELARHLGIRVINGFAAEERALASDQPAASPDQPPASPERSKRGAA